jgi:hypothetical protein
MDRNAFKKLDRIMHFVTFPTIEITDLREHQGVIPGDTTFNGRLFSVSMITGATPFLSDHYHADEPRIGLQCEI